MRSMIGACVVGSILTCALGAQDPSRPALRKGVSVQMAVADHALEMRAADDSKATVVAITANGEVFAGIERTQPGALSQLSAETVYVKADARVPFQTVLTVLDALRGKTVVLLAESPASAKGSNIVWPHGIKVMVAR